MGIRDRRWMIMNDGIREMRKLDIYKEKGRIGHRLCIEGRRDKKGDGMIRDKR